MEDKIFYRLITIIIFVTTVITTTFGMYAPIINGFTVIAFIFVVWSFLPPKKKKVAPK